MKERPILMTPENAQKCFDGTKTQTRRIFHPNITEPWARVAPYISVPQHWGLQDDEGNLKSPLVKCPYGVVGDRLWVREAFTTFQGREGTAGLLYRGWPMFVDQKEFDWKWTPAIHMPRWACRTVLELTEVRVERLQECSEADAIKEGCAPCGHTSFHIDEHTCSYKTLWESINGADSWALNPWVWVLTFRKVQS